MQSVFNDDRQNQLAITLNELLLYLVSTGTKK